MLSITCRNVISVVRNEVPPTSTSIVLQSSRGRCRHSRSCPSVFPPPPTSVPSLLSRTMCTWLRPQTMVPCSLSMILLIFDELCALVRPARMPAAGEAPNLNPPLKHTADNKRGERLSPLPAPPWSASVETQRSPTAHSLCGHFSAPHNNTLRPDPRRNTGATVTKQTKVAFFLARPFPPSSLQRNVEHRVPV